jgi:hypothetical protein
VPKHVSRYLTALAIAASMAACTGGEANKDQIAAGIDSLTKQRESTKARMDSGGVIQNDSTRADSLRRDSLNRATKTP